MIHVVRVTSKDESGDLVGSTLSHQIKKNAIKKIRTARVYYLEGITKKETHTLSEKLFSESFVQKYAVDEDIVDNASKKIVVSYKPGVMNPEVASIIKAAKDLGIQLTAADSATEYYFFGKVSSEEVTALVSGLRLFNPTVEHIVFETPKTLLISGVVGSTHLIPIRKMSDEDLLSLSKDKLYLNLSEMHVIQKYFEGIKRDPTDCELETIAQTWSEHCAHKTFKAKLIIDGKKKDPLIKRLQKESKKHHKLIVSSFVDNSGVMEFYDGLSICGKVETHNSPSAIEPYGGAATGSGGVFRDILGTGLGAKNIASTDIFCFAPTDISRSSIPQGCLPPEYLLKRVVSGVRDYGNRMGIPTNNGSVHFHPDFRAKPTVIVGAYGIIPTKKAQKGKAHVSDQVIIIGGRTGRDGIHGATFSSAEMTHETQSINSSAVQIGNAIEEKRMFDALAEASNMGLIRAIQDCGAGGFSSAIGEMGEEIGVVVDLAKAPVKYQGLSPWEIWVSESQERMACAVPKKNARKFLDVCKKYNVEAYVVGHFDGKKKIKVMYGTKTVCLLDVDFLYHGLPQREMIGKTKRVTSKKVSLKAFSLKDVHAILKQILADQNIASKEPIVRLYDHSVQGTNALQPFVGETYSGPTDAAIIRPILNKPYGMVLSHGLNPLLNNYDPYWGSIWAGVEALANYVAVGGNYKEASLINNYIWPFPDEESLASLDRSVDAVVDLMKVFKTPVISGKDSLSSTYRGKNGEVIKIPPVLCISVFGRIINVESTSSSDFKQPKSFVYLVGAQDKNRLGGSLFCTKQEKYGGEIPHVNLKKTPLVFDAIYKGIKTGQILSCHDISEGGALTALFEMCVGGGLGVSLKTNDKSFMNTLFNETPGCFIVEVKDKHTAQKLFKHVPSLFLGKTILEGEMRLTTGLQKELTMPISELQKAWQQPFAALFS